MKNKEIIIFPRAIFLAILSIISVLFFFANVLVFKNFTLIFGIYDSGQKFFCGILIAALSGGFVLMTLVEKYFSNFIIRALYTITAVWTGVFVYFFLASGVYNIVSSFGLSNQIFGSTLFVSAVILSIYGFFHHRKIYIKRINIEIPNIPDVWRGRTAVWMSDLHLGSIRGKRFSEKVTKISNSLSPDIVFIGGDLFDGTQAIDLKKASNPLSGLFSKLGIFFIAGNHEEFGDTKPFIEVVKSLNIKILRDEIIEIDGVQIAGVDYMTCLKKENFVEVLNSLKIDKNKPSILLKHEPKDLDIAENAGFSLQISGHTHKGQQWPFNHLVDLIYKGHGYGLKKYGKMDVLVSSGVGSWGPPIRVGTDCEFLFITFK